MISRLIQYGQGIYTAGFCFTVSDGQNVDAATTNAAFASKTADNTLAGNQTIQGTLGVTGDTTVGNIAASGTLGVTGTTTLGATVINGAVSGSGVLDDDAMTADSATALATQQSIKAYADTKVSKISSTDNQLVRFDGTGGEIQGSAVTVDDSGQVSVPYNQGIKFVGSTNNITFKTVDGGSDVTYTFPQANTSGNVLKTDGSGTLSFTSNLSSFIIDSSEISNADINFDTVTNSRRLKLPSDSTANLDALTDVAGLLAYDTTQSKPVYNNGSGWTAVGTGSGGGVKSFITGDSSDFEGGTVGDWVDFDDAGTITDGTGTAGTNVTVVGVTSTSGEVYEGTYSLKIGKANTIDCSGEGVSVDFDIDYGEQGKMQQISFSYITGSGFNNGSWRVYVYDKTNTTLLNVFTMDGGTGELYATPSTGAKFTGSFFPASDSTAYRLIIGCYEGSDADDYSFFIDEVKVGPISTVSAFNSTEWESFTPTITWTSGITTNAGWKKRVGDELWVKGYILLSGTPTTATLSLTIPDGLSIDTNKISGATTDWIEGKVSWTDNGTGSSIGRVRYISATAVNFSSVNTSTNYFGDITQAVPITWTANDALHYEFKVPISGWTSSDLMSTASADLRSVNARVSGTSSSTLSTATGYWIYFSGTDWDTHGAITQGSAHAVSPFPGNATYFTAPRDGKLKVRAFLSLSDTTNFDGTELLQLQAYNATAASATVIDERRPASGEDLPSVHGSVTISVSAGDKVGIYLYQASGTSLALQTAATRAWAEFEYVQDQTVFGVKGVYEVVSTVSSTKTPSGSNWHQFTGNDLTLSPGTWRIHSMVKADNSGSSPAYSVIYMNWGSANGDDTTSEPTQLTTLEPQLDDAVLALSSAAEAHMTLMPVVYTITEETTIYANCRTAQTTAANARVTMYAWAERLK